MKHDLGIPGFALGLRPITVENAESIVELRSDPVSNRYQPKRHIQSHRRHNDPN